MEGSPNQERGRNEMCNFISDLDCETDALFSRDATRYFLLLYEPASDKKKIIRLISIDEGIMKSINDIVSRNFIPDTARIR
jgi:hypothetical protein